MLTKTYVDLNAKRAKEVVALTSGVRPNEGLQAIYRARLERMIDDMHASLLYWIRAAYRGNTPEMAQDANGMSPAMAMRKAMFWLAKRWLKQFDAGAPALAAWFAKAAISRADSQLQTILKQAGFAVKFKMTREANDVMQATIGQQVGLIKSIAQQHLTAVEGIVMRSVAAGRDLGTLTKELQANYSVTRRRASFIALDQNNKATASINAVRQAAVGITQAIWCHSNGGKTPRPEHVKASKEKLVFDVLKGAFLEGMWVKPGDAINCRCFSRPILPYMQPGYVKPS